MTDKKTEALKLAQEALEDAKKNHGLVYVTELCAIREALAEQPAQQQELDELTAQRDKLADILTRTANALKGPPAELSLHSWHDLPEVAQQLKAAQQQEPVAWWHQKSDTFTSGSLVSNFVEWTPLYTSPQPSKPWVGLTDEEIKSEFGFIDELLRDCCYRIEAKLKEKNHG